jgi:signal transduction histidine kinase
MLLAILSHDLRNPLHCIRMAANVVALQSENSATAGGLGWLLRSASHSCLPSCWSS